MEERFSFPLVRADYHNAQSALVKTIANGKAALTEADDAQGFVPACTGMAAQAWPPVEMPTADQIDDDLDPDGVDELGEDDYDDDCYDDEDDGYDDDDEDVDVDSQRFCHQVIDWLDECGAADVLYHLGLGYAEDDEEIADRCMALAKEHGHPGGKFVQALSAINDLEDYGYGLELLIDAANDGSLGATDALFTLRFSIPAEDLAEVIIDEGLTGTFPVEKIEDFSIEELAGYISTDTLASLIDDNAFIDVNRFYY
ncbi:MAG: hypothetical protein J5855_07080 [Mailhella sp.]|nr:hypothetical protein [Mailhella sp.]